ncbi:unnamed protein product, partial [Ceratitis capitata]
MFLLNILEKTVFRCDERPTNRRTDTAGDCELRRCDVPQNGMMTRFESAKAWCQVVQMPAIDLILAWSEQDRPNENNKPQSKQCESSPSGSG